MFDHLSYLLENSSVGLGKYVLYFPYSSLYILYLLLLNLFGVHKLLATLHIHSKMFQGFQHLLIINYSYRLALCVSHCIPCQTIYAV